MAHSHPEHRTDAGTAAVGLYTDDTGHALLQYVDVLNRVDHPIDDVRTSDSTQSIGSHAANDNIFRGCFTVWFRLEFFSTKESTSHNYRPTC